MRPQPRTVSIGVWAGGGGGGGAAACVPGVKCPACLPCAARRRNPTSDGQIDGTSINPFEVGGG